MGTLNPTYSFTQFQKVKGQGHKGMQRFSSESVIARQRTIVSACETWESIPEETGGQVFSQIWSRRDTNIDVPQSFSLFCAFVHMIL